MTWIRSVKFDGGKGVGGLKRTIIKVRRDWLAVVKTKCACLEKQRRGKEVQIRREINDELDLIDGWRV